MRKVEHDTGCSAIATFEIANGYNGLGFRFAGEKVFIDLTLAPGPLFSTMTLDSLREDLERNSMSPRDMDDVLDTVAEKIYTSVIAKRLAENIRKG
jgi:hypothetical protein